MFVNGGRTVREESSEKKPQKGKLQKENKETNRTCLKYSITSGYTSRYKSIFYFSIFYRRLNRYVAFCSLSGNQLQGDNGS